MLFYLFGLINIVIQILKNSKIIFRINSDLKYEIQIQIQI